MTDLMGTGDVKGGPGVWVLPDADRRCTAKSKQSQERCRRYREPGTTVCRIHGGAAGQVRRKAALRLLALVDPAIATLAREMTTADRSADRQRAANSILDRAGVPRKTETVTIDTARQVLAERLLALRDEQTYRPDPDTVPGHLVEDDPGDDADT